MCEQTKPDRRRLCARTRPCAQRAASTDPQRPAAMSTAPVRRDHGVPQTVVGFTLVAFGTSLPELVTAVQAQRRRSTDLLVGNLLGSNLVNSLAGGAIVGLLGRGGSARLGYPVLAAMVSLALLTWLV